MNKVLAGEDIDVYINPWANWWTQRALTRSDTPFYHTDYIFYPAGASLHFYSFSLTNNVISLVLRPWFGRNAVNNVTVLLTYLFSSFGMYLLIEYLTGSLPAGIASGIVFAFNPYHIGESPRLHLVSTQYMPLALLFLVRWLHERKWRYLVLAALFFALNALSGWHLMTFFSLWLVIFFAYYLIFDRQLPLRREIWHFAVFALLAGGLVLPFLWPLIREQLTNPYLSSSLARAHSIDLKNLVVPSWIEPATFRDGSYLGLIAVLLTGIGVWKGDQEANLWSIGALLFLLIGIGPNVYVAGHEIKTFTLPWSQVFIPILRHPFRFQLLVMLGIAGAAGYGMCVIEDWLEQFQWRAWTVTGIALLLILDYVHWPFPTTTPTVSPFYEQLAEEAGSFAIASLPSDRQPSKIHMYYQTIHGKKITAGHIARKPPHVTRFIGEGFLQSDNIADISRRFSQMADRNIRYLVLDKDQLVPFAIKEWQKNLPRSLKPVYEDQHLIVYRTDLELHPDKSFAHNLTPSVGILDAELNPDDKILQGTFMGFEIYWGAISAPERDLTVQIELLDQKGRVVQTEQRPIYPEWSSDQWLADTIVLGHYRMRMGADITSGEYDVQIRLVDSITRKAIGHPSVLTTLKVLPVERTYKYPDPQVHTKAQFDEKIRLLGYDTIRHDDQIEITLYWKAMQLMETDYVMSIRLLDPSSKAIVWQNDAAPRNWSYPTTWWDIDEIVSDTVTCKLGKVSAGRYQLEVVVYEPETGNVLAASSNSQRQAPPSGGTLVGQINIPELD
jgi:hypothetical protein